MALLEARGVGRTFASPEGPRVVLRSLDFSIDAGEHCVIVGPSGAGKSTLLQILAGLDLGYEGSVKLQGTELRSLGDREASRLRGLRIGFIFQRFHLLESHSVLDNVLLGASFVEIPDAERRARDLLGRLGLAGRDREHPARLSGGERQRVAIVRALLAGPAILFCDEPTGSLDVENARIVADLLDAEAARCGAAVVTVTHDPALERRYQRRWCLRDGMLQPMDAP
jgi:putative ABC transport system ATP-binding protein